jgi:UDP-N-acetylglucosamine--N-acetylmuramyl-(pentapeptide) pyrophosphoryl-undecaprenol N-acetylglucosamine transferase
MAGAYDWADVIISRAGASSVAEIGCVNKPTLFVPYPYQQGTHQSDNAQCLVSAGKAVVVEELLANFGERLLIGLKDIFDQERYRAMKQASFEPRGLGASKTIALGILRLVKRELP